MIRRAVVGAGTAVLIAAAGTAFAADSTPAPVRVCTKVIVTNCVKTTADSDSITPVVTTTDTGNDGPRGNGPTGGGDPRPAIIWQVTYVPMCSGNTPDGNDALCTAAVESCPAEDEIRVWAYRRRYNRITQTPLSGWQRIFTPPTRCIGPTEPGIDPVVLVPTIINRDFKRVVVIKGDAEVSPAPDTLVNIPTVFETSAPPTYNIPVRVLGQSVVITVTAQKWTWHFGDGTTKTTTAKGTRGRVEHEYTTPASRQAYVVIEWSGTFSVNGGASQAVTGTATTTGDPIDVEVKQARSQLVDGG